MEDLWFKLKHFNLLPSHEGRHNVGSVYIRAKTYFNPLPSHEGRRDMGQPFQFLHHFNPSPHTKEDVFV